MADLGFLGMRVSGSWPANVQPENYRQLLMLINPNGTAPLLAIQSFLKTEMTDDVTIHYATKTLATQRATGTAGSMVYTNTALSSAYVSGGVAGDILYVKVTLAQSNHFRPGHTVLFRLSTDYRKDCRARVVNVVKNGASSYVAVKLRQADPVSGGLALTDTLLVIGNSSDEAGSAPAAISYDPEQFTNLCQTFWTTMEISRRMLNTKLRYFDAYQEMRREAMQYHGLEIERTLWYGKQFSGTGDNGNPITEMDGFFNFMDTNAAANVSDYQNTTDAEFAGKAWLTAGADWIDKFVYQAAEFGAVGSGTERIGFIGNTGLRFINQLARHLGFYQVEQMTTKFGMKVSYWQTPTLDIYLKTTPAFSYEPTDSRTLAILDPKLLIGRPLKGSDTKFLPDVNYDKGGFTTVDGKKEGWLTDMTMEFHNPLACAVLRNIGQANTAA